MSHVKSIRWVCAGFFALLLACSAWSAEQPAFPTPKDGFKALAKACMDKDQNAIVALLGEEYRDEIFSGDEVDDQAKRAKFVEKCKESARVQNNEEGKAILLVGFERWPFPIPMVKGEKGWTFDTEAGIHEIMARRIGRNELDTIEVCRTYVEAQKAYASKDRDGDEVLEYAQFLGSTPGKKDGLYWEPVEGEELSPLGPMVGEARTEGYEAKGRSAEGKGTAESVNPYHGYLFRIIYKQGKHAPGGEYDYIINDNMIAGFALVAWPVEYGNSGIMTFIVNQQGKVYHKDLGEKTAEKVKDIKKYDPDDTWELVEEE
jgi:hypothetical protein